MVYKQDRLPSKFDLPIQTTKDTASSRDIDIEHLKQYILHILSNQENIGDTVIYLNRIGDFVLFSPMAVIVKKDGDGFLSESVDLPEVYGFGEDFSESLDMLKSEIISLYEDLLSDEKYSEDWNHVRNYFERAFSK